MDNADMEWAANWSEIPNDLYVVSAKTDGIVWDVEFCSVPMALAPEVRYVPATALEAAQAELAEARAEVARLSGGWVLDRAVKADAERDRLAALVKEAVEGLRFYADPAFWSDGGLDVSEKDSCIDLVLSTIDADRGRTARATLAKLEGKG